MPAPKHSLGSRLQGGPCYIIAEMSANHAQSYEAALALVRAAGDAGADAIKLQTYTPDTLTRDSRLPEFVIGRGTLWEGRNLYELYGEALTPESGNRGLKRRPKDSTSSASQYHLTPRQWIFWRP
jgi:pseudaminic acid synthase